MFTKNIKDGNIVRQFYYVPRRKSFSEIINVGNTDMKLVMLISHLKFVAVFSITGLKVAFNSVMRTCISKIVFR